MKNSTIALEILVRKIFAMPPGDRLTFFKTCSFSELENLCLLFTLQLDELRRGALFYTDKPLALSVV